MYPRLHGTKKSAKTLPNLSGRVKLNSAQRRPPYHRALIGSHIEVNSLDQAQVLKLVRCRQSCKPIPLGRTNAQRRGLAYMYHTEAWT